MPGNIDNLDGDASPTEIDTFGTYPNYKESGLKDCVSEERATYYFRIIDESKFRYEDAFGDIMAEFKRVEE